MPDDATLDELIQAVADTLAWRNRCSENLTNAQNAFQDAKDELQVVQNALGAHIERIVRERANTSTSNA